MQEESEIFKSCWPMHCSQHYRISDDLKMVAIVGRKFIEWCICIAMVIQVNGVEVPVKEGDNVRLDCGFEKSRKTVDEGSLKWEAILDGEPFELADNLTGEPICNEQLKSCVLYSNGSIVLQNIVKSDGDYIYRCLRGGQGDFDYYSDHQLQVLPVTEQVKLPASFEGGKSPSASYFDSGNGVIHAYQQPVCRNQGGMNLNVSCTPASGELVQKMSKSISCKCYDSTGEVDALVFAVMKVDVPATSCAVSWILFALTFLVLLMVIIAILRYKFKHRERNRGNDAENGKPEGETDGHTDKKGESYSLLEDSGTKEDGSQNQDQNSTYEQSTPKTRGVGEHNAVQETGSPTENEEALKLQNMQIEKDWREEYNSLQITYMEYVDKMKGTLKEKEEKIEEWHKKYEEQKQKFKNLSMKFAQIKDTENKEKSISRSVSVPDDEPDGATGCTVSLQGNRLKAYTIGERKSNKQFHLQFSLESPGIKVILSSSTVKEASKFELEFKDGKIGAKKFGETMQEYIQCSPGILLFDVILDGCQLSLHETSPDSDGPYPLMELEYVKFNLCSFLDIVKVDNSGAVTIHRHDKLTEGHT